MLKILLLSFLVSFPALAQEQIYSIDDFSKGQISHRSPYLMGKGEAVECQNLRVNDEYGSLAKRTTLTLALDGGSTSINGLHRYYKNDATKKTIFATSTGLYYDASGTVIALKTGLTDSEWWQFVTYQDNAIGWNGADNAVKWDGSTDSTANTDGHRTAGDLCTDLGAPYAELNTGTNLDSASWYQYKVGFYDGTTYSYITARSNPLLTGAAVYDIYLTNIPIGPSGTTHRYIYRTLGNSSKANVMADTTFYKVSTIADNSTQVLADTVTDNTADDDAAPTWATVSAGTNATPPKFEYGIIHRERLFGGNNSTYLSNLYWSDEYNPDYFDPTDYEPIREDDGDEITFVLESEGQLVIGKTNSIQHFYTDLSSDSSWYTSVPHSSIGCPAPYSAAVTSTKGLFYYGYKGLYAYSGQSSRLISDAVTDRIKDISSTAIKEIVGYYFNNEFHLAYTSDESGEAENNRVLTYDLIRDAYVLDYKNVNCFESFDSGTDFGVLYSGSSGTDGYIYAHESAPEILSIRYKSQLDDGTYNDTRTYGSENVPVLELAWDCTIDTWLIELQTKNASINTLDDIVTYLPNAIIDRPDTDGTWTSPAYDLDSESFDKLYWREDLNSYGDITFQIRTDDNASMSSPSAWSTAVSDPSGSDMSGTSAERYVQVRINLSTTDIDFTPTLTTEGAYLFKLIYLKVGSTKESDFLSKWDSGYRQLGTPQWKILKRIRVFYTGTSGTLNIKYYNQDENSDNFDIDLSIEPGGEENYSGVKDEKIFTHYCEVNEFGEMPLGRNWRFVISEEGIVPWSLLKIEIKYEISEEID